MNLQHFPTEKERGDRLHRSRAGKVDAFPAVLTAIALLMTIGMAFLVQDRLRANHVNLAFAFAFVRGCGPRAG
jgi:hypothetical protein